MKLIEFIHMLEAIDNGKPFDIGFHLQHNSSGGYTIQSLLEIVNIENFIAFLRKVDIAAPPDFT